MACVVYAATMLAEMRFSNSFTRSLSLVAVRCSVILWYPSMRASRRDAMVSRSDSFAAPFAGGTVFSAKTRACATQEAWSSLFFSSS